QPHGALRTHYDVSDLELNVLVIHTSILHPEIDLLIADRQNGCRLAISRRVLPLYERFDLLCQAEKRLRRWPGRYSNRMHRELTRGIRLLAVRERHPQPLERQRELTLALRRAR